MTVRVSFEGGLELCTRDGNSTEVVLDSLPPNITLAQLIEYVADNILKPEKASDLVAHAFERKV